MIEYKCEKCGEVWNNFQRDGRICGECGSPNVNGTQY